MGRKARRTITPYHHFYSIDIYYIFPVPMIEEILHHLKKDFLGYAVCVGLVVLIVKFHLLSLCVFLLFIHLVTDIFVNGLGRRIPWMPRRILLWFLYAVLVTAIGFCCMVVAPRLLTDLARYWTAIQRDTLRFLAGISARYGIVIDIAIIKNYAVSESSDIFSKTLGILNVVSKGMVYFIFAAVLNLLMFLEGDRISATFTRTQDSLMSYVFIFVVNRTHTFFGYFRKVMMGQLFISLINTAITTVVLIVLDIPHKTTLVFVVFICGLIPVVGNLISNTILTITALVSVGPLAAVICLGLLVGVHKLEYFLNSKIIGTIIDVPMFVTLLALLVGEALLGVMGLVVALPLAMTIKNDLEQARADRAAAARQHTTLWGSDKRFE
ncbi:MAG: hypothetical protein A2268_15730 [Candidatus Raymondbacteria bacterium RifOxyA12_full_50_37]|uniref:AI-2E family transporter n=1 Tax=Candidatus Raymondbacteria bacterium RIFOXYD12_FULL_49_13 TaxID=1817890 RepID=A0A1F7F4E0_UNCRA|nr:MAG: hypothetical protein A2268_15730 [Candidatus Raymondbacteria bacterium RifOxyA12_full_50_37]OGJ87691.1 MAG: hypothetical protein A2248_07435 [Candidatus Raymondbacteria bacterium RIFOXYA2_FULL_49_16]OGJ88271.1 MAG: hypothetical protein A2350_21335 [Candidatus Raymondbacteria bacterium RifOxyB12_full_50_8]OGJ96494.1 MAG: hypothetical protein A2453_00055 [Candidatus Raymondbacteria bacterium RIFOXYC2_FULL_50_21]OGK01534.1 MAG: hypothetical protein A2519_05915 [Candidatus Raymondbacteria b